MPARRLLLAFVLAAGLLVGPFAGAAFAHVEAQAPGAVRGGSGTVTFVAEAEEKTPLTKIEVALPADNPLLDVTVPAKDGWTVATTPAAAGPVVRVIWTAAGSGIEPEGKGEFPIQVGRFPDTGQVVFKALVTYADGTVVSWIEQPVPGGPEPEQPAPVLELAAGTATAASAPASAPESAPAPGPATAEAAPTAAPTAVPAPSGSGSGATVAVVVVVVLLLVVGAAYAAVRRRAR
jgi:hypothetical protein